MTRNGNHRPAWALAALALLAALSASAVAFAQDELQVEIERCPGGGAQCEQRSETLTDESAPPSAPPERPPAEVHDYDLESGRGEVKTEEGSEEETVDLEPSLTPPDHEHEQEPEPERGRQPRPEEPDQVDGALPPVTTDGGSPFSGFGSDFISGDEALSRFAVPPFLVPIYVSAGRAYGIPWNVLAAINQIETDFGRISHQVSSAGALGWMQFMPGTWAAYGVDATGDGVADPFNPVDAIYAAARYLRASGGESDLRRAVFAYNHADWYVDRVLGTASIYGALPDGLVAETGSLAFGRFPVRGQVSYGDDFRKAERAGRRPEGLVIRARGSATAVATQNVKVERIVLDRRLARAFRAGLSERPTKQTPRAAALRRAALRQLGQVTRAVGREALGTGAPLPALTLAGTRDVTAALLRSVVRRDPASFGTDGLPPGYVRGRRRGVGVVVSDPVGNRYTYSGLRRLRRAIVPGARIAGGDAIGELPRGRQASMVFAVQAAGGEAVDPRPLVDGYRLQEASRFYHALRPLGGNPFLIANSDRLATVSGTHRQLIRRVLNDPGIRVYPCGREDVKRGITDKRVLGALLYLRRNGLELTVTSLRCGHSYYTAGGSVSAHSYGAAVDIAAFNGQPVLGHQGPGSLTEQAIKLLMRLEGEARPRQLISLMNLGGPSFAMSDHDDHLHVGYNFDPSLGVGRSDRLRGRVEFGPGGRASSLTDGKVSRSNERRLSRRLAGIENPRVLRERGQGALRVEAEHAGERRDAERLARRKQPRLRVEPASAGAPLIDIDVPAGARGDEAYALGTVSGAARPGWARRQVVLLAHRRGAWRTVGPPRDRSGKVVNPRLRALATVRGGRGYAVGDRGTVVELHGRRAPRLLPRVARARLTAVDASRAGRAVAGYAVGHRGTVLRLDGSRQRRERPSSELRAARFHAVTFAGGDATVVGALGDEPVLIASSGRGWRELDSDLGLPEPAAVRLTSVAVQDSQLWVAGAVAHTSGDEPGAEVPLAARRVGAGWRTYCSGAPELAAIVEVGDRTASGCDAALADSSERGAAGAVAVSDRGVVVSTSRGIHVSDSGSFRPVVPPEPAEASSGDPPATTRLTLSKSGFGWRVGPEGRLARVVPAGGQRDTATDRPLAASSAPGPRWESTAIAAVPLGGDRLLTIFGGQAALVRRRDWQPAAGPGVGIIDAAGSGDTVWAVTTTGSLRRYADGAWSSLEGQATDSAVEALAQAFPGGPVVAPEPGRVLRAIAFRSQDEGYAVGTGGLIARLEDDGIDRVERSPVDVALGDVAAGPFGVLAVGERGVLLERRAGRWVEHPEVARLVRGERLDTAGALADGTLLASAGGSVIVREPGQGLRSLLVAPVERLAHRLRGRENPGRGASTGGGWHTADLPPLGGKVVRLGGFRTGGGLHVVALVEHAGRRALLDGDHSGWREVPLPQALQLGDAVLDGDGRRAWVTGVLSGRLVATRIEIGGR